MYTAGKTAHSIKWKLIGLALTLATLILLLCQYPQKDLPTVSLDVLNLEDLGVAVTQSEAEERALIPNIVHFVHLVDWNETEPPIFDLPFRQFIAIYSAWYHLRPRAIYIHTNVEDYLIDGALFKSPTPYAQAISKIPNVKFNYHEAPNETTSGKAIEQLPHQSDFVRIEVLNKYGGMYLDDDAYILRDLKPLRYAGFQSVLGRQSGGQICNAVILSSANNPMLSAYRALEDRMFDGSWTRHSVDLLTSLTREYQTPGDLLLVPQDTFFPADWLQEDLEMIYGVHEDPGDPSVNNKDPRQNLTEFIDDFTMDWPDTWRRDWRYSYILHGWTSGIRMNMDESAQDELFGEFRAITPNYILANNSNFAIAVSPAMQHAFNSGLLEGVDFDTA